MNTNYLDPFSKSRHIIKFKITRDLFKLKKILLIFFPGQLHANKGASGEELRPELGGSQLRESHLHSGDQRLPRNSQPSG